MSRRTFCLPSASCEKYSIAAGACICVAWVVGAATVAPVADDAKSSSTFNADAVVVALAAEIRQKGECSQDLSTSHNGLHQAVISMQTHTCLPWL